MKIKYITLAITPLLLISQQNIKAENDFVDTVVSCGVIGGLISGAIGAIVYCASEPFSHSKEIIEGYNLLNSAINLDKNISNTYKNEILQFKNLLSINNIQLNTWDKYPCSNYINNISRSISKIKSMSLTITNKRNHLEKRKAELINKSTLKAQKMTYSERQSFIYKYKSLINKLILQKVMLCSIVDTLSSSEYFVFNSKKYQKECERKKTEKLNRELKKEKQKAKKAKRDLEKKINEIERHEQKKYNSKQKQQTIIINF